MHFVPSCQLFHKNRHPYNGRKECESPHSQKHSVGDCYKIKHYVKEHKHWLQQRSTFEESLKLASTDQMEVVDPEPFLPAEK